MIVNIVIKINETAPIAIAIADPIGNGDGIFIIIVFDLNLPHLLTPSIPTLK
jgi:hypothetical protein